MPRSWRGFGSEYYMTMLSTTSRCLMQFSFSFYLFLSLSFSKFKKKKTAEKRIVICTLRKKNEWKCDKLSINLNQCRKKNILKNYSLGNDIDKMFLKFRECYLFANKQEIKFFCFSSIRHVYISANLSRHSKTLFPFSFFRA